VKSGKSKGKRCVNSKRKALQAKLSRGSISSRNVESTVNEEPPAHEKTENVELSVNVEPAHEMETENIVEPVVKPVEQHADAPASVAGNHQHKVISRSNHNKLLPLSIRDAIVKIAHECTSIGQRTLMILNRVPRFKGIKTRIPEYYVLDKDTNRPISIVPHLNAIVMLLQSKLARKILPTNITLQVLFIRFLFYICV